MSVRCTVCRKPGVFCMLRKWYGLAVQLHQQHVILYVQQEVAERSLSASHFPFHFREAKMFSMVQEQPKIIFQTSGIFWVAVWTFITV